MTDNVVEIAKKVEARRQADAELLADTETEEKKITSKFIRDCLNANYLGDACLYKELHRGKFLFNKSMDCWMIWVGHHWEIDKMDEASAAIEDLVEVYLDEATKISAEISEAAGKDETDKANRLKGIQKSIFTRVKRLRDPAGRANVMKMVHTSKEPLAVRGDEFDRQPWLLACLNGVIDLRTGKLRDGRSDDYLMKSSPVEWRGIDASCPTWEAALFEILSDNQALYDFMQRLLGYSILGLSIEHIIAVWTGQGRNGKGLIVNIIGHVLGRLAGSIRSEMLLDQGRNNNAAGPTPDIMALRGLRMAIASETDENCRVSPARVKWLTGNDELVGRNPHDKYEVHFLPTHTLFLLTNHKPHAPADDFAFWERVFLVPFELSFVNRKPTKENERRADPELGEKLKKEAPGILAWLVKGCLLWQKEGLNAPAIVKEATAEYRRDEDMLEDFIDQCCYVDEKAWVGATRFYEVFAEWWKTNISNRIPKQKKFGALASKRFNKVKEGTYRYYGVGLLADMDGMDGQLF